MPALTEARRHRPGGRFFWVVEEAFAPLVQLHPAVSKVIPVATRRWRRKALDHEWREMASFRRAIRERSYDDVIDSQGLVRSRSWREWHSAAGTAMTPTVFASGRRHGSTTRSMLSRATFMPSRAIAS